MSVGEVDVPANGELELSGAAVHAAPQLLFGEGGEPTLDEIDPRRAGRREVQVEAGMPREPAMNRRCLVRAGVVKNEMHGEPRGHAAIDGREELAKTRGPTRLRTHISTYGG